MAARSRVGKAVMAEGRVGEAHLEEESGGDGEGLSAHVTLC